MQLFILYLPSWGTWNDLECIFHKHFLTDAAGVKFYAAGVKFFSSG